MSMMAERAGGRWTLALFLFLLLFLHGGLAVAASADFIHAEGKRLVDGHGDSFAVKGINLGNWLYPEAYLFQFKGHAFTPLEVTQTIEALVGQEQAARFWTKFREVYVTREDIAFIKAAGFNTVRVPLSWRLFVQVGNGAGGPTSVSKDRDGRCWINWCSGAASPDCASSSICTPRPADRLAIPTTRAQAIRCCSTCRNTGG